MNLPGPIIRDLEIMTGTVNYSLCIKSNGYHYSVIPACPESVFKKDSRLASLARMTKDCINSNSCCFSVIPACLESFFKKDSRRTSFAGMTKDCSLYPDTNYRRWIYSLKVGASGKGYCKYLEERIVESGAGFKIRTAFYMNSIGFVGLVF